MYYYIVENSKRKEFEKIEPKTSEILTSFDIHGEYDYVDSMVDVEDKVKSALEKGFSTIVSVGTENLANNIAVNLVNTKAVMGIIPFEEGILSNSLGLGNWKTSLEILAARRVLMMDVGVVNNKFFITELLANQSPDIPPEVKPESIISKLLSSKPTIAEDKKNTVTINVADQYQVVGLVAGMAITNLRPFGNDLESVRQSMIDEKLHLAFSDKISSSDVMHSLNKKIQVLTQNNISLFHIKEMEIRSEKPMFFWANNEVIARTPATLSVSHNALKVISGRLR